KTRSRCMLVDKNHRVLASCNGKGALTETLALRTGGAPMGHYHELNGRLVSFALTPGYETYEGLGWYGVIVQDP
ncbi:chemotaxis protein, partial [bacterium]|nr:chemotaxis protein [bacterium]